MRFIIKTFRGYQKCDVFRNAVEIAMQQVTDIAMSGFVRDFQWAVIIDTASERRWMVSAPQIMECRKNETKVFCDD